MCRCENVQMKNLKHILVFIRTSAHPHIGCSLVTWFLRLGSFLLLAIIAASCSDGVHSDKNSSRQTAANGEGMVTYKITYSENNPYKNIRILPRETNLVFKGAKASFITSAMGLIQVVNLLDYENKKYTSLLLNSVGENFAFIETPDDIKKQETNPEYKIETTSEKKTIAGLECSKAIVNDLTNNSKFDIFYYEKIKVYLGNCPYKDFNYLLMEYQDTKHGLPMHLEAVNVDFSPVDTTLLNIQGEYNWVDRKTFINILENLKVPI